MKNKEEFESLELTPGEMYALISEDDDEIPQKWKGWWLETDHKTGTFDGEKGSMYDYKLYLHPPEKSGIPMYIGEGGYYNSICGDKFSYDVIFEPELPKKVKVKIPKKGKLKTAKITLEDIKDTDSWFGLGTELGLTEKQIYKTFEHGEYGKVQIIVDENLNIIGGKIIPCGK